MRLTDLHGARVRRRDGSVLGRVWEVHCKEGRVIALGIGAGGLLQRMAGGRDRGPRIPWEEVAQLRGREILLGTGPNPKRSSSAKPVAD
jgi:sporulation protein YlmC with PRC-barrel domain